MRGREDRGASEAYLAGCDILGAVDMSSVMPWLSLFASGGVSDKDKAAAAEAERKRAEEKARQEVAAARTNAILYTGLAVIGTGVVGAGIYLIARRK